MTEQSRRSAQPRDVPPPRPVEPVEGEVVGGETGLGPAARALADAVAGLLGRDPAADQPRGASRTSAGARAATGVLSDVISAVAAAARSAADPGGAERDRTSTGTKGSRAPSGVLTDLLDAAAPRLPIRDRDRLRQAYPGASDAEIADALVARATKLTAGIGAAVGGLTAAQWFAPPSLIAVPLELGAQTVLVAAVEVVLVGELHELADRRAAGDAAGRARAYLTSWTTQRPVGRTGSGGLFGVISTATASAMRRQVTRRLARSTTSMAPLLVGATLAARANRKATGALADELRGELGLPPSSAPR
ncbi:conserved protein of unknown function [Modestobacter italicus]|uniref:Uncharacterized protein n=1 Tax=Modestobacter italicus (strain DSM 44449 / CECT 9708 / BC 501) TaxID=2732864 RepID=I4F117_MODI5|nr:hypothetical protein [Modestobacter marinus]CCH89330.1 conserved protein of unknown function [Modestobacter marinus]